jgi:hypothetical protein
VKSNVTWTKEKLNRAFKDMENVTLGSRLQKVLDWALSNGSFLESTNESPSSPIFGLRGKYNVLFVRFIRKGEIFVYLSEKYTGGEKQSAELVSDLKKANLLYLNKNEDFSEIKQGRNLSKTIQDLSDKEFNLMLQIFSKHCI